MSRLTGSDALGLMEAYAAVYAPQREIVEEVEIAAQYFYNLGLNEDGVEIVIEELGEDEFTEWVYELAEEYVLTEEETRLQQRSALKGPKGSKPQSTTKARVKKQGGVEMKASARPGSTVRPGKRTAAVEKAKESQPQKKGGLGAIADRVREGMKRHNKAVADTKKTIGKAAKGVGHVAREFGKGVSGAAKFAGAVAREVTKEEVEEWVNSLIEEGYDLSEYTWEDMYEQYLSEMGQRMTTGQATAKPSTFKPTPGAGSAGGSGSGGRRGSGSSPGGLKMPASKPAAPKPTPTSSTSPSPRPAGAPAPTARPSAAPAPKVSTAKVAPTKPSPKGDAMSQWKSNFPKLASKVTPTGERAGTQMGTGQSTMSKQAADLRAMRERLSSKQSVAKEEYDAFDLVLEYLIDNGHVETVDEALYVMMEMDSETIQSICKES